MGFNKAVPTVGKELIDKYTLAKFEYAKACRRITKLRLLAEAPRASDAEIVAYARARKEFREDAKNFNSARSEFTSAMSRLTVSREVEKVKDSKFLEPYEDLTIKELQELRRKEVFKEEMAEGKFDELIRELKAKEAAKRKVMNEVDPTTGFDSPFEETQGE